MKSYSHCRLYFIVSVCASTLNYYHSLFASSFAPTRRAAGAFVGKRVNASLLKDDVSTQRFQIESSSSDFVPDTMTSVDLSFSEKDQLPIYISSSSTVPTQQNSSELFSPAVLSAALLITGNTVGASCLALPNAALGPGIAATGAIFIFAFLVHLLSGLTLAEIAIKQHENSGDDIPSSFKAFADATMENPLAGNTVSFLSMFTNVCVLVFNLMRAGVTGSSLSESALSFSGAHIDPSTASIGFAAIVTSIAVTQSGERLASIASGAVAVLFASFAAILIPGLANVRDPVGTFFATQTADDLSSAMLHAAPIFVQAAVYQNIVPSVTKILSYDRQKVISAIFLGSLLPSLMYFSWTYAVIGGGIDLDAIDNPFLIAFSVAALYGSALGCVMSIAEELDEWSNALISKNDGIKESKEAGEETVVASAIAHLEDPAGSTFSWQSVSLAVSVPLAAGLIVTSGGHDDVAVLFLGVAGAYGAPLLYGAIPVAMAWSQREKMPYIQNLIPTASLGVIGVGSMAFIWQELSNALGQVS
mmetsp:Transcript_15784/g.24551  ORF Transcript_15784/g.24551 Transcript_15784/m.24551 type:complete len:532 (+) Transcript_15784:122-1717(+)